MKVIQLFGGPGSGKSRTAAMLFALMKNEGYKVELVREWVKTSVYENRESVFEDQLYILAKQNRALKVLENSVDWVVTDSPVLLGHIYRPTDYYSWFDKACLSIFNTYQNFNFFLQRAIHYETYGRRENLTEARTIDSDILRMLRLYHIPFTEVFGDKYAAEVILLSLQEKK